MLKTLWKKYRHGLFLLYGLVYMAWFIYLEKTITTGYNVIHMKIDDYIPFIEVFVVPYMLWFLYVAITVVYFLFTNKRDFFKLTIFLFTGMTLFLIISTLYPNGQNLRPLYFERNNIFINMVKRIYMTDTPTNILPSIHVFNSLGTHIAICNSQILKKRKGLVLASGILMTLIILSTLFIKQHSVFDVLLAFAMAYGMYAVVYRPDMIAAEKKLRHQLT